MSEEHNNPQLLENLTMLGRKVTDSGGKLEVFPAPQSQNLKEVTLYTDEIYAHCPVTGQPDFYSCKLTYWPDQSCVESKSVKLYFQGLRDAGIFCEHLSDKIARDFFEALAPHAVRVELIQRPRGGISITAVSELKR
ncbi:preQ(1) synthase [Deinococcus misasensis]|uniref:preQ(1) synthase n=1 Tax=Deinococcus misasensis TaxID=392413 RepID=UPI000A04C65C|nr:preQ(1) synthase [Deinococcus misasensis]